MPTWSAVASFVPATLLMLSACGGNAAPADPTLTMSSPSGGYSLPPSWSTPASSDALRVEVTETDFAIALSKSDFTSGTYTFVVSNAGAARHDLVIAGPGVDGVKTSVLRGGELSELAVTLQPGEYQLWCAVGNHRARGMELKVNVSG